MTPYFAVIFTVIAFFASFFPTSKTTGGYVANENGLNYQTASYMAAYASSFCLYYIICFKELREIRDFTFKFPLWIMLLFLLVNLLSIFIAGGRGGLVLYVVQFCFACYVYYIKNPLSLKQIVKYIGMILLIIIVVYMSVHYAQFSNIETNGFERILNTINKGDTNGRNELRSQALMIFSDKPILGHGFGSVFYEIGIYSHNCFTDALVEIGFVGCVIYFSIILLSWRVGMKRLFMDYSDYLWLIFFLNGLIPSLFSGYYLASFPLLWAVAFLICSKNNIHEKTMYNI